MLILRCFFAYCSLILRSSYIVPISNVRGKKKEKKFLSWLFKKKWLSLPQNLLFFLQCSKLRLDCDEILFTILFSVIIYWLSAFSGATASRGACGYRSKTRGGVCAGREGTVKINLMILRILFLQLMLM